MNSLIDFLLKNEIIKLSRIEDSFFLHKSLDKKIKLTPEIVQLNYLKESPYARDETNISSILVDSHLYLWFHREQQRYLPEAILLYRHFALESTSVLCIIKSDVDKVIIIKENVLVSSFSKKNLSKADINIIKDEYRIDKLIIVEAEEYDKTLKNAYQDLKLRDLLNVFNFQIDFKKIWGQTITALALPLLVSSVIYVAFMGAYSYYLNGEKNKLHDTYKANRLVSSEIKKSIDNSENQNLRFNQLVNELKYHEKTYAISSIIQVTDDMNMSMHYIKVYNNKVDFIIRTKEQEKVPLYIKKLFSSPYLLDVKNISSSKLHDQRVQITMTARLKGK